MPVAVKVNGEFIKPETVAVKELLPAVVPKVQEVTLAIPEPLVATLVAPKVPPPLAMAKVTVTPETTLPPESFTITEGTVETALPAVADCASPAFFVITVAGPTVGVIDCVAVKLCVDVKVTV